MSVDWGAVWTALGGISGLVALGGFLFYARANRRKINAEAKVLEAEANDQTLESAFKLIGALEVRMDDLEAENKSFKRLLNRAYRRIEQLMKGIRKLLDQLADAGLVPCWQPDEWDQEPE